MGGATPYHIDLCASQHSRFIQKSQPHFRCYFVGQVRPSSSLESNRKAPLSEARSACILRPYLAGAALPAQTTGILVSSRLTTAMSWPDRVPSGARWWSANRSTNVTICVWACVDVRRNSTLPDHVREHCFCHTASTRMIHNMACCYTYKFVSLLHCSGELLLSDWPSQAINQPGGSVGRDKHSAMSLTELNQLTQPAAKRKQTTNTLLSLNVSFCQWEPYR